MRYADDWTKHEGQGAEPVIAAGTPALATFQALVDEDRNQGLRGTTLKLLDSQRYDSIVEVGPGSGGLSRLLAERCDNLVLVDLSLRSLLCSQRIAAPGGAKVAAILGDVGALEMASDCASAVVAANVVDLLEVPERFLVSVSRWLVRRGELILTTPEPSLGGDSDDALRDMMESLEYKIDELRDGIPWLRVHTPRYSQLYWLQALRAQIVV
jgi:ubiquinone/menaquinone biosynthesis C-methylase UbiE